MAAGAHPHTTLADRINQTSSHLLEDLHHWAAPLRSARGVSPHVEDLMRKAQIEAAVAVELALLIAKNNLSLAYAVLQTLQLVALAGDL